MGIFTTSESFTEALYNRYGEEYIALDPYINSKINIRVKHSCGHIYRTRPDSLFRDDRGLCPKCQKKKKLQEREDALKEYLLDTIQNDYVLCSKYKSDTSPVKLKHTLCGHYFKVTPNSFKKGTRCEYCRKESVIGPARERLKSFISEDFELLEYVDSASRASFKCKKCESTFSHFPSSVYRGAGCPNCNNISSRSRGEIEVYEYVKSMYPEAKNNTRFRNKNGNVLELDIYVEELKIGIEYDGLYWHSDKRKSEDAMKQKKEFFEEFGIRVVHIFEDEWENRKDIVKQYLTHLLKKDNSEKISARKCEIKTILKDIALDFLNKNSLIIYDDSDIFLGAYYKNELVAVMSFRILSEHRKKYYLKSFATSKHIHGAFNKMVKYFASEYGAESIIAKIDLRFSSEESNILKNNGFEFLCYEEPDFYYCQGTKRFPEKHFSKKDIKHLHPEIFNESLTAYEMMENSSYFRVYNCGKIVYELRK
jgi:hypothetical protein